MKKACRPPTEACPQRHDTHPHAVRRDRPGDQPPGPDDSMRRGPGGGGGTRKSARPKAALPLGLVLFLGRGPTPHVGPDGRDCAGWRRPGRRGGGSRKPASNVRAGATRRDGAEAGRCPRTCGRGGRPMLPGGQYRPGPECGTEPGATRGPPARAGGAGRGGGSG